MERAYPTPSATARATGTGDTAGQSVRSIVLESLLTHGGRLSLDRLAWAVAERTERPFTPAWADEFLRTSLAGLVEEGLLRVRGENGVTVELRPAEQRARFAGP